MSQWVGGKKKEGSIADSQSEGDVMFPRKWKSGIILTREQGRLTSS